MNDGAEHAASRRGAEVFRSLCAQSGLTIRELADLVEERGLHTAIRIAAGRAQQRARGRHMVAARRRLLEHYESMW
jgi:hypothetical protein